MVRYVYITFVTQLYIMNGWTCRLDTNFKQKLNLKIKPDGIKQLSMTVSRRGLQQIALF